MEQGQKLYAAIFKRVWRSMKEELQKLYVLNGIHLPIRRYFGESKMALREDYLGNPDDVAPSADPNITSDSMAFQQIGAVKQAAMTTAGYDLEAVERRFLKALKVSGIDEIFPGPKKIPPAPHPKVQVEQMKLQYKQWEWKVKQGQFAAQLMEDQRLNSASINKLEAEAVKLLADIQGDKENRQIEAVNAAIGALKAHNDILVSRIELIMQSLETGGEDGGKGTGAGAGAGDDTGRETSQQGGTGIPGMEVPSSNVQAAAGLAQMAGGPQG